DVEMALVVRHEDERCVSVERGLAPGMDADAGEQEVDPHPELSHPVGPTSVDHSQTDEQGREERRVQRDADQLEDRHNTHWTLTNRRCNPPSFQVVYGRR